jgi:hypothetical protein
MMKKESPTRPHRDQAFQYVLFRNAFILYELAIRIITKVPLHENNFPLPFIKFRSVIPFRFPCKKY